MDGGPAPNGERSMLPFRADLNIVKKHFFITSLRLRTVSALRGRGPLRVLLDLPPHGPRPGYSLSAAAARPPQRVAAVECHLERRPLPPRRHLQRRQGLLHPPIDTAAVRCRRQIAQDPGRAPLDQPAPILREGPGDFVFS